MDRTVPRQGASIPAVIAAILLPPLGVFLDRGMGSLFWISLVLTLFAFIPGMIFALLAVFHAGF